MNGSVHPRPPATHDEIEMVYPDLATVILRVAGDETGQRYSDIDSIIAALRALGHREPAIRAAIEIGCQRDPITSTKVVFRQDCLAHWKSLAIALSGGGLRATLFELGILLYLAIADELKHVSAVVSVSGGSILAAHLARRWPDATQSQDGFIAVAADLIRFARRDIRNSAIIAWIWHIWPLATLLVRSWRRIWFLERQYKRHFDEFTLGQLPSTVGAPLFAFVATDIDKRHRVALSKAGILRFTFAGELVGTPILADGVYLSLTVAASSCFPPVFRGLRLTYRELGIRYDEFDGTLNLSDGGVSGNLGVEVLSSLLRMRAVRAMRLLVCDAECGLPEPITGPLAEVFTEGAALSETARQVVMQMGSNAVLLRFANRTTDGDGLPFRVQTRLSSYRTDLDQPSWQECHALLMHGAAICDQALATRALNAKPTSQEVHTAIRRILETAGAAKNLPTPDETSLERCGRRSYSRIWFHGILALILFVITYGSISEVIAWLTPDWQVRPLTAIWRHFCPEPVVDRSIDIISADVATAICGNTVEAVEKRLLDGRLSRLEVTVGAISGNAVVYTYKKVRPPMCDRDINCEFVFRGQYSPGHFHVGDAITITGRLVRISTNRARVNAYIDFEECIVESARGS